MARRPTVTFSLSKMAMSPCNVLGWNGDVSEGMHCSTFGQNCWNADFGQEANELGAEKRLEWQYEPINRRFDNDVGNCCCREQRERLCVASRGVKTLEVIEEGCRNLEASN